MYIVIIDYGAGNLRSIAGAVRRLGYEVRVSPLPEEVERAAAVILPGVGAAGKALEALESLGTAEVLRQIIADGRPFLGICLGLQILFDFTEEGEKRGLGILPGRVRRFPAGLKVPHMGWNRVRQRGGYPLFEGIPDGSFFYFAHSYYPEPEDPGLVAGETEYGFPFPSVVVRDNVVGVQFHPEKSGDRGLRMLHNFLHLGGRRCWPGG